MKKYILIQEIFYFLTAAIIIFIALEIVKPRMVLAYLNLNWLIFAWVIMAVAVLFVPQEE